MKNTKILNTDYDVSGGDKNFETIVNEGKDTLLVQYFVKSLSQIDNKLRLQISLDGVNFVDYVDNSGTTAEITLDETSDILKIDNFNTSFFRFQFVEGTAGTGTLEKLIILTQ